VIIFGELTDEITLSPVVTLLTANMSTVLDIVSSSDNVVTIILTQIIKAVHIIMMRNWQDSDEKMEIIWKTINNFLCKPSHLTKHKKARRPLHRERNSSLETELLPLS